MDCREPGPPERWHGRGRAEKGETTMNQIRGRRYRSPRRIAMRRVHEDLLAVVARERNRLLNRRGVLTGGVRLAAGGALALAAVGSPALGRLAALAAAQDFKDDLEVLNYALTLEHLAYAFY